MTKRQNPAASGIRRKASRNRSRRVIRPDKGPRPQQYVFGPESLIGDAAQLKSALTPLLSAAALVMLDVSALQRIDGAALQILCAFLRERRSLGHTTEWRGVPAALRQAAGLLGLVAELGLPQQEAA
jgi:phospholipid transport system transporter-binding protein